MHILVVNPNSSQSVTSDIKDVLERNTPEAIALSFLTGPSDHCPPTINDDSAALVTAEACLPLIISQINSPTPVDGVLIACYSEHPLVPMVTAYVEKNDLPIRVDGMFEASLAQSLDIVRKTSGKFGILTTGRDWEPLLNQAVHQFLKRKTTKSDYFVGTVGTGLGVLDFHSQDAKTQEIVHSKLSAGVVDLVDRGASVICLGCAGMSGLKMESYLPVEGNNNAVIFVDGLTAGVGLLTSLLS